MALSGDLQRSVHEHLELIRRHKGVAPDSEQFVTDAVLEKIARDQDRLAREVRRRRQLERNCGA